MKNMKLTAAMIAQLKLGGREGLEIHLDNDVDVVVSGCMQHLSERVQFRLHSSMVVETGKALSEKLFALITASGQSFVGFDVGLYKDINKVLATGSEEDLAETLSMLCSDSTLCAVDLNDHGMKGLWVHVPYEDLPRFKVSFDSSPVCDDAVMERLNAAIEDVATGVRLLSAQRDILLAMNKR
jgi:hypothetical protein